MLSAVVLESDSVIVPIDPDSQTQQRPSHVFSNLRLPQPRLITHIDGALFAEAEIAYSALDQYLAYQYAVGIPYLHSVAAARVNVA